MEYQNIFCSLHLQVFQSPAQPSETCRSLTFNFESFFSPTLIFKSYVWLSLYHFINNNNSKYRCDPITSLVERNTVKESTPDLHNTLMMIRVNIDKRYVSFTVCGDKGNEGSPEDKADEVVYYESRKRELKIRLSEGR
jgi:hypothetical protein